MLIFGEFAMEVKVNFYAIFRQMAKGKTFTLRVPDNATVKDVLEAIRDQVNKEVYNKIITIMNNETRGLLILVNGRNIVHLDGLNTKISEKDKIDIFPPGAGGS